MSDCVAWPRWAAHRRVLGRADSATISAPCVLALHSPIAPARRASFRFDLLVSTRVELEITPEPTDDERAAILAALEEPAAEPFSWREDEPEP